MDGNAGTPTPDEMPAGATDAEDTADAARPATHRVAPEAADAADRPPPADTPAAPPTPPAAPPAAPARPGAPPKPAADRPPPATPATSPRPGAPPKPAADRPLPATPATSPRPGAPPGAPGRSADGAHRPDPAVLDLPDARHSHLGGHDRPLVLGGTAAAEGRTTGPTQRVATATPHGDRAAAGGAVAAGGPATATANGGRHFGTGGAAGAGRPRWLYVAVGVPLALLVGLVIAWAIDTAALSGQVMRNVEVGGKQVGGLGEASLPSVMDGVDNSLVGRPVEVTTGEKTYKTTAGKIGLSLDSDATTKAALDAGRGDMVLIRPFTWAASFFHPRRVGLRYAVKQSQVEATMLTLQGADLTAGQPPTIMLGPDGWAPVPGTPGKGVDVDRVVSRLPRAAARRTEGTIVVRTRTIPVTPGYTDDDARKLAERANQMTADGLALTAGDATIDVPAATLRAWIGPVATEDHLDLAINGDAVGKALPDLFARITVAPVDAGFTLQNGVPTVTPARAGVRCCATDSAERVWKALTEGRSSTELETVVVPPRLTTEKAKTLGIKGPVGGNFAWRDGAPTTAGPGFTTYYQPGQARVTNIHRIADLVRGAVILPGETFSINERVGQRTTAKGFVEAGAIRDTEHVPEVGGGVSQFATTTFNAAYFAGLDIPVYQAHSEYFSRYPRGREATMGFPAPDLKIKNTTPYGILVWTSYTANSVTVTLYSTPYATAEQTGISESPAGACTVVRTTRTRTYPDGRKTSDTFRATYRPGEGQRC